jgi:hypothetical protein
MTKPEEDYARCLDVRMRKTISEHEGWLRHTHRQMRIMCDDAKDGMQVRVKKLRTVVMLRPAVHKGQTLVVRCSGA